jgi:cell volume regulation protein A
MSYTHLILVTGLLLAAGLVASLMAVRLRVPALVLFLGLGMLIGSDGTGWIALSDYNLTRTIGVVALALILFEGGLASSFHEIRPVLRPSISLAFAGTLLTAVIAGLTASWLFDFSMLEGLLVGSILAGTDGAAIFSMLRGSSLERRLARTLEGEAGMNDPVAVLLVIGFIDWIQKPGYGLLDMAGLFAAELVIGAGVGLLVGRLGVAAFNRVTLASAGLYPVTSLAVGALAFGTAGVLHGSGFLAVYLAGLTLGGARIPAKRTVAAFHDGLAWIAQIVMFLALGLLVFPSQLGGVALEGSVLALALVFVARPVAAFAATAFDRYSAAERLALGWAGLRGAVPVVLATFPVIDGVPRSLEFFNIVFFAVVLSTLLQGSTFELLARRLRLTTNAPALPRPLTEAGTIRALGAEIVEHPVAAGDAIVGLPVRDIGLPRDALLNVIVRAGEAIPPRGSTTIAAGDVLHLLVRQEVSDQMPDLVERWRTGPLGPPRREGTRPVRAHRAVFSVWRHGEQDGDPAHPSQVSGVDVIQHLRTRRDMPGALVELADGRYAITGPLVAVGPAGLLQRHVRRRLRHATSDEERAWWQEVAGALTASSL